MPRTLQAETLFSTSLDRSILLGNVDLVHRTDGDGVEIVDFKTLVLSAHFLRGGHVVNQARGKPGRAIYSGKQIV
ncbi:MAG: hypothetical protein GYA59_16805 [Chloroflexi bacterium]|nr:hypothetical protein [Chloroflexota bacterium]